MRELSLEEINDVLLSTHDALQSFIDICDRFVQYHPLTGDAVVSLLAPHIMAMGSVCTSLNNKLDRDALVERMEDPIKASM